MTPQFAQAYGRRRLCALDAGQPPDSGLGSFRIYRMFGVRWHAHRVTIVDPIPQAMNYRDKAEQLREMAASAPNDQLRDQFATLAGQYEHLAHQTEIWRKR
jgi:hypothetical protein